AARFAEGVLARHPQVRTVYTSVGHDNPTIYYNVYSRVDSPRVGQLFVLLDQFDKRHTPLLLDTLRVELARYPGAELAGREFEQGPPIDAPIALRVSGPSLDTLGVLARRIAAVLEQTPGTQYVTNPVRMARTDLRVDIEHGKAGLLGVPTIEIDRMVRLGPPAPPPPTPPPTPTPPPPPTPHLPPPPP